MPRSSTQLQLDSMAVLDLGPVAAQVHAYLSLEARTATGDARRAHESLAVFGSLLQRVSVPRRRVEFRLLRHARAPANVTATMFQSPHRQSAVTHRLLADTLVGDDGDTLGGDEIARFVFIEDGVNVGAGAPK